MQEQQTAVLQTQMIPSQVHPDGDCFQFWYFLHYYDTGSIHVTMKHEDGTEEKLVVLEGDRGPMWRTERLPMKSATPYQVLTHIIHDYEL